MGKSGNTYWQCNKFLKLAICFAILFMVFLSFMQTYNDILITAKQGLKFWDVVFSGHPFSFYKEASMTTGNLFYPYKQDASYPFGFYFIFSIWNLPIWIIESIFKVNVFNTIPGMFWQKLLLILFVFGNSILISKTICDFDKKKDESFLGIFLFISSLPIFMYTCAVGQYEIITVFFILLGFRAWYKSNNKVFIAMFAIAFSFKYFSFICFVPLLLLIEKNILKIIYKTLITIIPTVVLLFVFPKPESGASLVSELLKKFFIYSINMNGIVIPVFLIAILFICLWCFLSKPNEELMIQHGIFALLFVWGAFCLLAEIYPYWSVLSVPFIVLAVFFSNGNRNKMIMLETVLFAGLAISFFINYHWVTGANTVYAMGIIPKIFGKDLTVLAENPICPSIIDLVSFVPEYYITLGRSVLMGVLVFVWGIMLYFCYPGNKKNDVFEAAEHFPVIIRTVTNVGISLIPIVYAVFDLLKS